MSPESRQSEESGRWATLLDRASTAGVVRGIAGGLVGTALMTVYRYPIFRALPPTAEFWGMVVGDREPTAHPLAGLLLHFGYGGAAGGLFGLCLGGFSARNRPVAGLSLATLYGFVLSVFGERVLLNRLLGERLETEERAVFHAAHLVWALTLGTWLSARKPPGDVYE